MAVRKRIWKTKGGKRKTAYFVDLTYTKPNGEKVRIRRKAPGNTRRAAEEYERQLVKALIDETYGTYDAADMPTVEEFAEEWFEDHVLVNNKQTTQRTRRSALNAHLIPFFGEMNVDDIDGRAMRKFKKRLIRNGAKPKTVNNHLGILSSMLTMAVEDGLVARKPKIPWMKVPDTKIDFLDFDEAARFLVAAEQEPEWHAFFMTALQTGLRLGELAALLWDDVDLVRAEISVMRSATRGVMSRSTKSMKLRTVAIPQGLVDVLTRHKRRSALRGRLVFSDSQGGVLTRDKTKHVLKRVCRRAGLRQVGHHTMRHTYASHLVMRGVPLKIVQELLGHATLEMTMRYAHLAGGMKNHAVRVFDTGGMFDSSTAGKGSYTTPKKDKK